MTAPADGALAALRRAATAAAAGALLLAPLVVPRVDTVEKTVSWRWANLGWCAAGTFIAALLWQGRGLFGRWSAEIPRDPGGFAVRSPARRRALAAAGVALALALPAAGSTYQVNVLTSALIAVILGLGLNVIVGLAGLLNLGYAAFYAVGAYAYALAHQHFGVGFWLALPLGGLLAAGCGLALGFPVLRLRGDYLAIVTLGFGEIVRLVLENWSAFSNGPSGIPNIPRAALPGWEPGLRGATTLLYYVSLALAALAALVVRRLRDSRIGRAWVALREDELAAEAMGIDRTRVKLAALAAGAFWAGIAGVLFAARTTFVSPASFTFLESAMALAVVVLGGPGSVGGVAVAAVVLVLLPEYLRPLAQYRMLVFGAALVVLMIWRAGRPGLRAGARPAPAGACR
ncbi:MAG TPA: branched-chain amino acid ABC transporter permease [bacterium]